MGVYLVKVDIIIAHSRVVIRSASGCGHSVVIRTRHSCPSILYVMSIVAFYVFFVARNS